MHSLLWPLAIWVCRSGVDWECEVVYRYIWHWKSYLLKSGPKSLAQPWILSTLKPGGRYLALPTVPTLTYRDIYVDSPPRAPGLPCPSTHMSQAPHRRTTSRDDSRTLDSTLNTLTDQLSRTTLAPQSHTIAERFPGSAAIQSWNAFSKPLPLPPGGIPPPLAFAEDPLYPGDGGQRRSHSSPNVPLYKQEVRPQASVPASLRPGNGRAGQVVGGRLSENDRRSPAWGKSSSA